MKNLSIGAFLAGLASLVQLTDWLERKTADPPPRRLDARLIGPVALEKNRLFGDYLRASGHSRSGFSAAELARPGIVASVRVRIRGYEGQRLLLRWTIADSNSAAPLPGRWSTGIGRRLIPANQDHRAQPSSWIPIPRQEGTFVVRLTLEKDARNVLDAITSPSFDVAAALDG